MKKLFFACWIFTGVGLTTHAQVSLQPTIPSVGMIQKNQLWNVLVVNNTTSSYECRLSLVLRDRITGQELLTATTSFFTLTAGAKQLNANVVAPIQYNNLQSGIDNKLQGLLPVGTYTACYELITSAPKVFNLSEECVPFDTEPLSPPLLITPADSSVLEIAPAQFSWIPPTPDGMFDGLHYEVLITPINEGQKPAEAIQENLPIFNNGNQLFTTLTYPNSTTSFEKEKWYAWQVVAKDKGNYAGKSEVWLFKVSQQLPSVLNQDASYLEMGNSEFNPKLYTFSNNNLKVNYYSYEKEQVDTIRIFSSTNQLKQTVFKSIIYGNNFFTVDINFPINNNEIYTIEITDKQKKKIRQYFQIQN
jgi:hypothetical protein